MKTKLFSSITGLLTLVLLQFHAGLTAEEPALKVPSFLSPVSEEIYIYPSPEPRDYEKETQIISEPRAPFLDKSFVAFKEALAFRESSGNYFSVNQLGYLGKYQFGVGTLQVIGLSNTRDFLNNPVLQEEAFYANTSRNKWILRRDLKRFEGAWIDGIHITESGILAAAHLAGAGNVKKYLRSYGEFTFEDAFGTSIKEYLNKFSGYDVSPVEAVRNPKIS